MRSTPLLRTLTALLFAAALTGTAQAAETENPIIIKSMAALNADGEPQLLFNDGDIMFFSAQIETASEKPMLLIGRTAAAGVDGFKGKTFFFKYIPASDNYTIYSMNKVKVPAGAEGVADVTLELFNLRRSASDNASITISLNKTGTATETDNATLASEIATGNYYTPDAYLWKYTTNPATYLTYADLPHAPNAFIIDVRTSSDFVRGHIQDAFNLSRADLIDNNMPEILYELVPDLNTPIITYCDGYGQEKQFADKAAELGYQNVRYYAKGMTEWKQTKYQVVEAERVKEISDAWDNSSYIVDVWVGKNAEDDARGMVPHALPVDLDSFWANNALVDNGTKLTNACPDKTKPIIFYCGDWACKRSQGACTAALKLGYTKVYRYQGGIVEWKDKNGYTTVPTP
jgi:rhodanese-related sulfurtransferase